jgi:hypothetical protein
MASRECLLNYRNTERTYRDDLVYATSELRMFVDFRTTDRIDKRITVLPVPAK